MGLDYSWIGVEKQGEKFLLKQAVCKDAEQGNLEQVSTLAVLEPSRKFEAGLFPNYEKRDLHKGTCGQRGILSL